MPSTTPPDDTCDLLVVGSGAGALSTAVTAAHLGLKVIVVEKDTQFGGTTAWSGGWMWVPRNPLAVEAGLLERIEKPLSYLRRELGEKFDESRALAFLNNGPRMVEFFRRHTALQFIDGNAIPDFHGHTPDAALGGRSICAAPFDARQLGARLHDLNPPLKETTLWGMGIASGAELRHFLNALHKPASFWYVTKLVLRHWRDLLVHHRGTRLVNGNALVGGLAKSAFDLGIDIRVNSPAVRLLQSEGRVNGAVVQTPHGEQSIHARCGVVLATGGFPHDPLRKQQLLPHAPTGHEHWSAGSWSNTGDGLRMGESAGGVVANDLVQAAALAPVSLVPRANPGSKSNQGSVAHFPHLIERAKPGLIAVTLQGQRFTNEANSYHDFMQGLLAATPAGQAPEAWLVCDHAFIRYYGLGAVKPAPMMLSPWLKNGYLKRGHSLAELAKNCGINAQAFQATVQRYNALAQDGKDRDFGKGETPYNRIQGDAINATRRGLRNPCMGPIESGPFYAVKVVMGSLGTFAGLRVNDHAQVIDAHGQAIPGLYAGGNDLNSMMGGHYPAGGITLGPAMTFGFIAAHHAAGRDPAATCEFPISNTTTNTPKDHTMYYELATMTLPFGTAGQAATNVQAYATSTEAQGELLGCWFTDIGQLNQMIVLRGFATLDALQTERERTQKHSNPFGCGDIFQTLEQHSYKGFPWMKPVRPSAESGITGPVYEIRTYGIKTGGVQPTIDLWEQYVPARDKLSACVVAMVALDGPLRFTNIWAYDSLNARSQIRAEAVAQGIWPPKGGPAHLTTHMVSTIAMPTAVSPLK
ncbi:FAD-dependent oxidoreductase [Limnohabitans sp. Rim47]|uniref:FAD-dependent oxidoreductase n=1 Tax=Limnohabitans sp. Rim47 TaxID=1100721 RepID=UPI000380AE90|nr:FAD-dependent oxidoreductase [Limnohabitans sp. Rim47]